ncbi:MAG: hypothetical protein Q4D76_17045 [Oscillospiraceae bacterium]|nr:hypothetical protein [Oscillospiraceae bacterium]
MGKRIIISVLAMVLTEALFTGCDSDNLESSNVDLQITESTKQTESFKESQTLPVTSGVDDETSDSVNEELTSNNEELTSGNEELDSGNEVVSQDSTVEYGNISAREYYDDDNLSQEIHADISPLNELYLNVLDNYKNNIIPNGISDTNYEYSNTWQTSTGNTADYGYKFHDLNGDGQDELFIVRKSGQYMYKVCEIYTIYSGSIRTIAIGDELCYYWVICGDGVLAESRTHSSSWQSNVYYHLQEGKLVAFERFDFKDNIWYYAEGDGCELLSVDAMNVISDEDLNTGHEYTFNGIQAILWEYPSLFSDY